MKKGLLIFSIVLGLSVFSLLLADITLLPLILLQLRFGAIFGIILLLILFLWFCLRVYLQWQELKLKKNHVFILLLVESVFLTIGKGLFALTRVLVFLLAVFLFAGFLALFFMWHQKLFS